MKKSSKSKSKKGLEEEEEGKKEKSSKSKSKKGLEEEEDRHRT